MELVEERSGETPELCPVQLDRCAELDTNYRFGGDEFDDFVWLQHAAVSHQRLAQHFDFVQWVAVLAGDRPDPMNEGPVECEQKLVEEDSVELKAFGALRVSDDIVVRSELAVNGRSCGVDLCLGVVLASEHGVPFFGLVSESNAVARWRSSVGLTAPTNASARRLRHRATGSVRATRRAPPRYAAVMTSFRTCNP
jgi:hypothetical protein